MIPRIARVRSLAALPFDLSKCRAGLLGRLRSASDDTNDLKQWFYHISSALSPCRMRGRLGYRSAGVAIGSW